MCLKRTFPSDFVKLVSEKLNLFLAEESFVVCLFCLLRKRCNLDWRINSSCIFMAIFHPAANNFLLCIIHVFGNRYYYQLLQAREADMSHWVEGAPLYVARL